MLHTRPFYCFALLASLSTVSGCNLLFPELSGSSTDMASSDLAGDLAITGPYVTGLVCAQSDLRVLGTCVAVSGHGLHVSVEETRDTALVDSTGHFTVNLSQSLTTATLGISSTDGSYLPTVAQVTVSTAQLAIPVYVPSTLSNLLIDDGLSYDDTHGLLMAYVVAPSGLPVLGVKATATGGSGVLYDGRSPNQLDDGASTGANGVVLLVNQPASSVQLTLTPTAGSGVGANQFTLPIRPGAVTFAVTVLPAS